MAPISRTDSASPPSGPSLEAFERAAAEGDALFIEVDGEQLKVLARGCLPDSGRAVAWVEGGSSAPSTARVFSEALAERFGTGLARHVARELGLDLSASKPIESRTVQKAIDMARTASTALDGNAFAFRLSHSAVCNSPAFVTAAEVVGVLPDTLDGAARKLIDERFASLVAASDGPETPELGRKCLEEAVRSVGDRAAGDK